MQESNSDFVSHEILVKKWQDTGILDGLKGQLDSYKAQLFESFPFHYLGEDEYSQRLNSLTLEEANVAYNRYVACDREIDLVYFIEEILQLKENGY